MALRALLNVFRSRQRLDPTRTLTLRTRYSQAASRRFRTLRTDVRTSIIDRDVFGFSPRVPLVGLAATPRRAFDFPSNARKHDAFMEWLHDQVDNGILEITDRRGRRITSRRRWQDGFIRKAYEKGVKDARSRLRQVGIDVGEFSFEAIFNAPVHVEQLELLFARNFDELRGITEAMSQAISRELSEGLASGEGMDELARRLSGKIDGIGRRRAELLARTETINSHAQGTLTEFERLGISEVSPDVAVEFLSSGDERVCQACLSLEGIIYSILDARSVIPVHPNCLPGDALVTASPRIMAVFKRWFDSELVVFRTASGKQLSCTPNHPILTNRGWVPACLIQKGEYVLSSLPPDGVSGLMTNDQNIPARIEDIAETFFSSSEVATIEVPITSEDFYAEGTNGEVCVIGANVELLNNLNASRSEQFSQSDFNTGYTGLFSEPSFGDSASMLKTLSFTPNRVMSSFDLSRSLFRRHTLPDKFVRFGYSPGSVFSKPVFDKSSTNLKFQGQFILRHPAQIQRNDFFGWDMLNPWITNFLTGLFQFPENGSQRNSKFISNVLGVSSGTVFPDQVINIDVRNFSGHVYDLQTESGLFMANSIASFNCRCSWIPANIGEDTSEREERQNRAQRRLAQLREAS